MPPGSILQIQSEENQIYFLLEKDEIQQSSSQFPGAGFSDPDCLFLSCVSSACSFVSPGGCLTAAA